MKESGFASLLMMSPFTKVILLEIVTGSFNVIFAAPVLSMYALVITITPVFNCSITALELPTNFTVSMVPIATLPVELKKRLLCKKAGLS